MIVTDEARAPEEVAPIVCKRARHTRQGRWNFAMKFFLPWGVLGARVLRLA